MKINEINQKKGSQASFVWQMDTGHSHWTYSRFRSSPRTRGAVAAASAWTVLPSESEGGDGVADGDDADRRRRGCFFYFFFCFFYVKRWTLVAS